MPAAIKGMNAGLQGYRQLTDAYLLALANRRKGVLATFDRAVRTLAGKTFDSDPLRDDGRFGAIMKKLGLDN